MCFSLTLLLDIFYTNALQNAIYLFLLLEDKDEDEDRREGLTIGTGGGGGSAKDWSTNAEDAYIFFGLARKC